MPGSPDFAIAPENAPFMCHAIRQLINRQWLILVCYNMLNVDLIVSIFFTSYLNRSFILDAMPLFFNLFPLNFGQELVPCVLLSFDNEQVLMWRGQDWKSMYEDAPWASIPPEVGITGGLYGSGMH